MLLITALLLLLQVWAAHGQTASSSSSSSSVSSNVSASAISSSATSTSPFSSSSSSSFYAGNEPAYPGCYLCPAITQCPPFPNTTVYPAFSIVATTSATVDAASCSAITSDILVEVTQYASSNSCIEAIGYLACYGSLYQELDCQHSISPEWPALCENYTACLEPAGQAFINQSGLCTNIQGFLNRPVSIQPTSSSSASSGVSSTSTGSSSGSAGATSAATVTSSSTAATTTSTSNTVTAAPSSSAAVVTSSSGGGNGGNTVGSAASANCQLSAVLVALAVAVSCALLA